MLPLSCSARRTHSSTSRLASFASCTAQRVTRGLSFASFGKSHSCETPTTWSISPSPAAISVAAGNSETMRCTHKHTRCLGRSNRDRAPDCTECCRLQTNWLVLLKQRKVLLKKFCAVGRDSFHSQR